MMNATQARFAVPSARVNKAHGSGWKVMLAELRLLTIARRSSGAGDEGAPPSVERARRATKRIVKP